MIELVILLILIGSILLSLESILSYHHRVRRSANYSLFLVRIPQALSLEVINKLHQTFKRAGFSFSVEKLYKGGKVALVIFAPGVLIRPLSLPLGLLEIEDYSQALLREDINFPFNHLLAFHLEPSGARQQIAQVVSQYSQTVKLLENEQIWCQLVLRPESKKVIFDYKNWLFGRGDKNKMEPGGLQFNFNLRIVILADNESRAKEFYQKLVDTAKNLSVSFYPQIHSKFQIVNFYLDRLMVLESLIRFLKRRSFYPAETYQQVATSGLLKSGSVIDSRGLWEVLQAN